MYQPKNNIKNSNMTERERMKIRDAAILSMSPYDKAKVEIGQEQGMTPFLNREDEANLAETIAAYAPGVGAVGGAALGGLAGGTIGALTGGPAGILPGAGTGVAIGSALGGGAGQLASLGAQGVSDQYQDDLNQQAVEEEARRQQLLMLLSTI